MGCSSSKMRPLEGEIFNMLEEMGKANVAIACNYIDGYLEKNLRPADMKKLEDLKNILLKPADDSLVTTNS